MTQIVSSISGIEIYAPSAGYAPTNAADVSAIASGYAGIGSADASAIASAYAQSAVSSVSGDYYSTSNPSGYITGIDLSDYATTAYVDSAVSGVEISFDSSITTASSTAGITAGVNTGILSGKLDASASSDFYLASNPSGFITGVDLSNYATTSYVDSAVSGVEISFDSSIATASSTAGVTASVNTAILSAYAYESSNSAKLDATAFSTVSSNFLTSQTVTALGDDGTYITSINGSALSGQGGGGGASLPITGSVGTDSATYGETSVEFNRYDTAGEPDIRTASLSPDALDITYTVDGNDFYSVRITENGIDLSDPDGYYSVTPYDITNWNSAVETVANNSANWGGGGAQVVTATGSASATSIFGFSVVTSYLVSSINGSAILPYGYSSLSSNSAKWTSTNSAVSANSAKWTGTNSAVSANSASWTGTNSAVSANSASWNSAYSLISGVTALMDAI